MRLSPQVIGTLYVIGAYSLWGFSPIFWRTLEFLAPLEIVAHRIIWSIPIILVLLYSRHGFKQLGQLNIKDFFIFVLTSILVSSNWLIFIWSVANNRLVEASLGYFIYPLLAVFVGLIFFKEKLTSLQYLALLIAACGVAILIFANPHLPWIALSLAATFTAYVALRKHVSVDSLTGLSVEILLLFPFAVLLQIYFELTASNNFQYFQVGRDFLILLTILFTVIPLLWMVIGVKATSISSSGILFYINPSLQFLVAVVIFNEPVQAFILTSFVFIWLATIIYFLPKNILTNYFR